jgi:tetratricopeptide (TPR) repeat protein
MLNPFPPPKHAFNQIKQRIPPLNTVEQKSVSILKIITILLAFFFFISVAIWIFQEDDGISIQPFKIIEICNEPIFHEDPVTDLLCFELQKIKETYRKNSVESNLIYSGLFINNTSWSYASLNPHYTPINSPFTYSTARPSIPLVSIGTHSIDYSISQVGNVGSLSLGHILLFLKELLHNQGRTITGSMYRYNSSLRIVAILNDPRYSDKNDKAWEVRRILPKNNLSIDEAIYSMVEDLAFQIVLDTNDENQTQSNYPQTWQAFKYYTLGWDAYHRYNATRNVKDLDTATSMTLLSQNSEPNYLGSYELLFTLGELYLNVGIYNEPIWGLFENITHYKPVTMRFKQSDSVFVQLGIIHINNGIYKKAIDDFNKAIELNPQNADAWNNKGIVLSYLGKYDEALQAYDEAIKLS